MSSIWYGSLQRLNIFRIMWKCNALSSQNMLSNISEPHTFQLTIWMMLLYLYKQSHHWWSQNDYLKLSLHIKLRSKQWHTSALTTIYSQFVKCSADCGISRESLKVYMCKYVNSTWLVYNLIYIYVYWCRCLLLLLTSLALIQPWRTAKAEILP